MGIAAVILAAGEGKRMKSTLPKGLHPVCGVPMVELVGRALAGAGVDRRVMVVGHGRDQIQAAFSPEEYAFVVQEEQHGTGHAALMGAPALADYDGPVIISPGDTPLITSDAIQRLLLEHIQSDARATVATFHAADPAGYGRLVRDASGHPVRIVEHKDASPAERALTEVNSAVYCFDAKTLFAMLPKIGNQNAQGEYYLTDVLRLMAVAGMSTHAVVFEDPTLFQGVNDRWQLAEAAAILQKRIVKQHCLNGVTIIDPASTFIGLDVEIETEVVLEPMTVLEGSTRIGAGTCVMSFSRITDSTVGSNCIIKHSTLLKAVVGNEVNIGPYAHLRPKSTLGHGVRIGNFVEVKNAELGDHVAVGHLSYVGDAEVGAGTNIGAGTITCNYDGYRKHRTVIGEGAFVGSNSTLVAPIQISNGAYVAAGSTLTHNVTSDALAIGRARQVEKEQWAQQWREKNMKVQES